MWRLMFQYQLHHGWTEHFLCGQLQPTCSGPGTGGSDMNSYSTAATGLELQDVHFDASTLRCDTFTSVVRPVLPKSWTHSVFNHTNRISDAGVLTTQQPITQRFVWNSMKHYIHRWYKECRACQAPKIQSYTKTPLVEHPLLPTRFFSLHVDLFGPQPASQYMPYLFTRPPEAIPLHDAHASTCLLPSSTIGFPGLEFHKSSLQTEADRSPQSFGLNVRDSCTLRLTPRQLTILDERFHHQLHSALKSHTTSSQWYIELPRVLRSSWGFASLGGWIPVVPLLSLSMAQLFICLVNSFSLWMHAPWNRIFTFLKCLQYTVRSMQSRALTFRGDQSVYVPSNLASAWYIYVRRDAHRHSV